MTGKPGSSAGMIAAPHRRSVLAAAAGAAVAGAAVSAALPAGAQVQSLPLTRPTLAERVAKAGVPALGFAVVGPDGVHALEVAGRLRIDRGERVATGHPWHIGSNTKAMTAALYARLVEQGRAGWGARLPSLFPDLKLHPAWGETRIEDLLAHRSGVTDRGLITPERLRAFRLDPRPVAQQRTSLAAEVFAKPPAGQPDAYDYANAGYILAGAAIERIAKTEWEAAVTLGVFQPLGMESAGFGAPTGEAPLGHELGPGKRLSAVEPGGLSDNPPIFGPAGRVHLSLADYAKFARVFLADGAGFLKPESLAKLARPWSGEPDGYALGWEMFGRRAWAAGPVLAHEGSNTFWRATALIGPARGLAFLTVCNAEAGGGAQAAQALSLSLVKLYAG